MQNLKDQTRAPFLGRPVVASSPAAENRAARTPLARRLNRHQLAASLPRIRRLSRLMDSAARIPGTRIRFGLDGLIGLIPGLGDAAAAGVSAWIVREAYASGVPNRVLAKMLGNIAIDFVGGTVPLVGDVFDVYWKANLRNVRLLEEVLRSSER